jgi:hypothetical protein
MHHKAIETPAERDAGSDDAVLGLLLYDHAALWSVAEIEREIGGRVVAQDSLARLYGAGLVHRVAGDFVCATRAALRGSALASGEA